MIKATVQLDPFMSWGGGGGGKICYHCDLHYLSSNWNKIEFYLYTVIKQQQPNPKTLTLFLLNSMHGNQIHVSNLQFGLFSLICKYVGWLTAGKKYQTVKDYNHLTLKIKLIYATYLKTNWNGPTIIQHK